MPLGYCGQVFLPMLGSPLKQNRVARVLPKGLNLTLEAG